MNLSSFIEVLCLFLHEMQLQPNSILVAEPFLGDTHFHRSVIQLLDYSEEGAFGLILNQPSTENIGQVLDEINPDLKLFIGGPVETNRLFYIHNFHNVSFASEFLPGIFVGGDFEEICLFTNTQSNPNLHIQFFRGYSGWGPGQLEKEIEQKSWIVAASKKEIFLNPHLRYDAHLWKFILQKQPNSVAWMSNAPSNPQLN